MIQELLSTPNDTDSGQTTDSTLHDSQSGSQASATLTGEDLVLQYSSSDTPVIDGETITAEPGAVTALIGPNGSGKSTLLKGLAAQLEPEAGSVLVDGAAAQTMNQKAFARTLGLLSQESATPESITVEQLAFHGRYPHRGFLEGVSEEDEQAVDTALELAGCKQFRDRAVGSLSGGQRQLVWIAMALAQETDILLLDEPTTFLDLHHQLEVMEIIETLCDQREITVVVVLHDIEQAARLADKIVALKDGTIQACGSPEEVVTEQLLADVFRIDAEVGSTPRGPRIEPLCPRHGESTDSPAELTESPDENEKNRAANAGESMTEPAESLVCGETE